MSESVSSVDERAQYISEKYDVPLRAGYALQLAEAGLSNSGIAKRLGVTKSTVDKYQKELESKISEKVWWPITSDKPRFDTFPTGKDNIEYAGDYIEYAPEFAQRERPLRQEKPVSELDIFNE